MGQFYHSRISGVVGLHSHGNKYSSKSHEPELQLPSGSSHLNLQWKELEGTASWCRHLVSELRGHSTAHAAFGTQGVQGVC